MNIDIYALLWAIGGVSAGLGFGYIWGYRSSMDDEQRARDLQRQISAAHRERQARRPQHDGGIDWSDE